MKANFFLFLFCLSIQACNSQSFYFGADLSYVNEMEDCGVSFSENNLTKDPYSILYDQGNNLVRLRLWHTPAWYDNLNSGNRYSNLEDVKRSIARAKENNMKVLLDYHLSDNWADPSKQLVPDAWLSVVDDTAILKDSLYNYLYNTLNHLNDENLLPEMIQIGNETNKGILLSPEDNEVWMLDWDRNAELFNHGIKAVRDFENDHSQEIEIVLHVAGPANAEWLIDGFITNGVTDFDIIGMSYYWAWHMPTTIAQTGQTIETLRALYPEKEVMIVETGYIWTTQWNDNASNIISETHPDFSPASPINQRDWLIALTEEVIASDGIGVIYWEPCWVSSECFTQWGQGSHQEHATYFDFESNLILPGGIEWMSHDYGLSNTTNKALAKPQVQILTNSFSGDIKIKQLGSNLEAANFIVVDSMGSEVLAGKLDKNIVELRLENTPKGIYVVSVMAANEVIQTKKLIYGGH